MWLLYVVSNRSVGRLKKPGDTSLDIANFNYKVTIITC